MMDVLDRLFCQQAFVDRISPYLELYRQERHSPFKATFRCHICGDSQTNRRKKRGAIVQKEYELFYICMNCGVTYNFQQYLKLHHSNLYSEYLMEVLQGKNEGRRGTLVAPVRSQPKAEPTRGLKKCNEIPHAHSYLKNRCLSTEMISDLYYTEKFYGYINSIIPEKFSDEALKHDHERIVIPLRDIMGTVVGVQGRFIGTPTGDVPRYITIMFSDKPKIFNLDRVDTSKIVYVLEGPLDAMFIPNAVAMTGMDADPKNHFTKFVMVLDNQNRNKEVLRAYDKYITNGYPIVIWPNSLKYKDINAMIIGGLSQQQVAEIIRKNTFSGLIARQKFSAWRKL